MSDAQNFGFAQFVPGFDFLQNLAKGAAAGGMPQMPGLSNWIAPTLSVEELDKRISELRAVMFWLEQNGKALQATIQALEVQKMTLATLKGMDVTMADMAEALKVKTPAAEPKPAAEATGGAHGAQDAAPGGHQVVDPLQWWSSLTQQFQQIAANAMQQAAQNNPMEAAREVATGMAEQAIEAASRMSAAATPMPAARKSGASKTTTGRTSTRTAATRKSTTGTPKTAATPRKAGGRSTR